MKSIFRTFDLLAKTKLFFYAVTASAHEKRVGKTVNRKDWLDINVMLLGYKLEKILEKVKAETIFTEVTFFLALFVARSTLQLWD